MNDNDIADSAFGSVYRAVHSIIRGYAKDLGEVRSLVEGGYGAKTFFDRLKDHEAEYTDLLFARLGMPFLKAWRSVRREPQRFAQIDLVFDAVNPEAIEFLRGYALDLVSGIDDDARSFIREQLIRGQTLGIPPRTQAKIIESAIGLTPRNALAISNLTAEAYRQAIARGMSVEKAAIHAERVGSKAADKAIKYRAETIARTETIRAQNAGQQEAWNISIRNGLLPPDMEKQWITTYDDRTCLRICVPMDRVKVHYAADFDTPAGAVEYPPAHPRCRCTVGLARP